MIFSILVVKEVRNLSDTKEHRVISYQVLKSAISVGANFEEAQGAVFKVDFANNRNILKRDSRNKLFDQDYYSNILSE